MLKYLFARRWLGLFSMVVVLVIAFLLLARWQWHRREERLASNLLISTNYDQKPVLLNSLLPDPGTALPTSLTWRPVRLTGHYEPSGTLLVRNRSIETGPNNSAAGFYVLVPFADDGGHVLLVNRGWIPTGSTGGRPDSVPAPPSGDLSILARLRMPESTSTQQAPRGQAYRLNPSALAQDVSALSNGAVAAPSVVTGGYGDLAGADTSVRGAPILLPEPDLDEGPHLSYAVQWVLFAIGGVGGFIVLVRRSYEDDQADEQERLALAENRPPPPPPRDRRKARRTPTDEEVEDAQLDAAPARNEHIG